MYLKDFKMFLGAEGIQAGTCFLVANETNIHENYKCISICYELSGNIGGINDCCAKRLV